MPTPTEHAMLSASSAHRWLKCTAAPHFEEQFPSGTSVYAEEGSLAHGICELYAKKYFTVMTKRKFNAELKKLQQLPHYSDEMLKTAEAYLDYLKEKAMNYKSKPYVAQEIRVDFSDYVPDGFGTCDCVMIGDDTLHITDYKHGRGVPVSAKDNPQMRLYALGALKMFTPVFGDAIKKVSMGICQPRLSTESNEECLTVEELIAWGESIKPLAQEAYSGPGSFCPGEHCRFCKGKAKCRARADYNTAFEDFKDCIPLGKESDELKSIPNESRAVLGLPPVLSDTEIGDLLVKAESLVQWYTDLKEYALSAILSGNDIPGWKVVAGTSRRAFKNTDEAIGTLIDAGYDEALIYDRKPKSLAELEKVVGKKEFGEILKDHIEKPIGKPTLVPLSDKREPYSSASSDFAGVTNG
ncbi:MAG: DUF2800 domain-containing protein [Ruminococcus flavefaciens]|nr:DUF2800 domain-containing protein [Ruminococcus flavefaciens]